MAVRIKTTEHFSKVPVIGTFLIFLCLTCKTKHLGPYSFYTEKISHFFLQSYWDPYLEAGQVARARSPMLTL